MSQDAVIYIVDDDPAVREGLASLVRSVGHEARTFATATGFLEFQRPERPACLVLDVRLPGLSGLELQRTLNEAAVALPIIFITGHGDIPTSVRAIKAGAVEFLPKPFDTGQLLEAIDEALHRDRDLRAERVARAEIQSRLELLSPREREVAARVVEGLLNKQIAADLGISEITVKVHRRHVMRKLGARSVAELVRMAGPMGLAQS